MANRNDVSDRRSAADEVRRVAMTARAADGALVERPQLPGKQPSPASSGPAEPAGTQQSARRFSLISYLLTVFALLTLNFLLPRSMPGDPVSALVDAGGPARVQDDALRAELAEYYGLDRPLVVQYGQYLGGLAKGDLGTSIRYSRPVASLVRDRLPWTLLLIGSAMAIAVALGWIGGIHSGWRRGRAVDRSLLGFFLGLKSFPVFFVGSLALMLFSVKLGWFPLAGTRTPFGEGRSLLGGLADVLHHLALPAFVLALDFAASQYLVVRAGMVSELGADYLVLGRAKGLRERDLKFRYAARNALLPAVTLLALHISFAVTGAILVETVFAYQGLGRLVFEAVAFRDYPVLQACFLVLTLVVVTANFLAEALYRRLDPRVAP